MSIVDDFLRSLTSLAAAGVTRCRSKRSGRCPVAEWRRRWAVRGNNGTRARRGARHSARRRSRSIAYRPRRAAFNTSMDPLAGLQRNLQTDGP